MQKSEVINELAKALALAQKEFGSIKRTEHVGFEGKSGSRQYNYAPLEVVIEACRASLSKNGLAVLQLTNPVGEDVLRLETVLTHESGQWISSSMDIRATLDKPQDQGSSLTYARRYSLAAILNVASEEDDDAEGAQERGKGKQTEKPHICLIHDVPFLRMVKGDKVWYSHKDGDTWCNEPKPKDVTKEKVEDMFESNVHPTAEMLAQEKQEAKPEKLTRAQADRLNELKVNHPMASILTTLQIDGTKPISKVDAQRIIDWCEAH